jgi:hypothetical protein
MITPIDMRTLMERVSDTHGKDGGYSEQTPVPTAASTGYGVDVVAGTQRAFEVASTDIYRPQGSMIRVASPLSPVEHMSNGFGNAGRDPFVNIRPSSDIYGRDGKLVGESGSSVYATKA